MHGFSLLCFFDALLKVLMEGPVKQLFPPFSVCFCLHSSLLVSVWILPFSQNPVPTILGQTCRAKLHPETPSITSNDGVIPEHLWSPKLSTQNFLQLLKYRKRCTTLANVVQFPLFLQKRNQPPQILLLSLVLALES